MNDDSAAFLNEIAAWLRRTGSRPTKPRMAVMYADRPGWKEDWRL